ncbi:MAG: TlpA family protein disulfide reductase [Candidatus Woesearchaeota archaeon]
MKAIHIISFLALIFLVGCQSPGFDEDILDKFYLGEEGKLTVYYFYGYSCPVCAQQSPFLDRLEEDFDVEIIKFEVYNRRDHQELFRAVANEFGIEATGVPTTFIGDKYFVGFNERVGDRIVEEVENCLENSCDERLK